MAGIEVETQTTPPVPLTGYAEVTAAFQLVRQVRISKLRWQPEVLSTVLYEDTELARPEPRRHVGENEVLMKNVYYLATRTKNISEAVVFGLIDAEVLTVEEGDLILQQPTNKLRAVKLYAILVEKEDPNDGIAICVVSVLHAHDNEEVSLMLSEYFGVPIYAGDDEDGEDGGNDQDGDADGEHNQEGQNEEEDEAAGEIFVDAAVVVEGAEADEGNALQLKNGQWACQYCTFINNADTLICGVCAKTVDFNLDNSLEVNICPQCTLMNEHGVDSCEACGFEFLNQIQPLQPANDNEPRAANE